MSSNKVVDWRKEPSSGDYEMTDTNYRWEPTIFPASESYGKDRAKMARRLDCEFTEVRMETYWMRWLPEEAEDEWRRERCECDPPAGGEDEWCCEPISECKTTKPAESVHDFWDEDGIYCPWVSCKATTPGAVKFRRGRIAGDRP